MSKDELDRLLRLHTAWLRGTPGGSRADLSRADLSGADLYGTNLSGTNLYGTDLSGANLYGANLSGANLSRTNLSGANLSRTNLSGANLSGTNLSGANLSRTTGLDLARFRIVPDTGSFVGYKKAGGRLLELEIPAWAKRVNAIGSRKCRASAAKLLRATTLSGRGVSETEFMAYAGFVWTVGKTHKPDSFDPDITNECSHGLHFFITKQEAIDY